MSTYSLIILICLGVALAGCGNGSSEEASSSKSTGDIVEKDTSATKTEKAAESEGATTQPPLWLSGPQAPIRHQKELQLKPTGLAGSEPKPFIPHVHRHDRIVMKDLLDGIGTYAFQGERVVVQYVGYDYKTGKKFASSWDKGRPVTFTLGAGEVIPAWEEALDGMEIADRRVVVVPPKLARGSYPPHIPHGKTVAFILELLPRSSAARAEQASVASL